MMSFTKAALATALSLGAVATVTAAPAFAQKKGEAQAEAKPLKLSPAVRKPAAELEAALTAGDMATAEAKAAEVEAAAKSDDEKYYAGVQRLQIAAKKNDMVAVGNAVSSLISNPRTPQADLGKYHYFRGTGYLAAKNYQGAVADFQKAQQLGYSDPNADLRLRIVQAQMDGGDVAAGLQSLRQAIAAEKAAGRKAPEDWYKFGRARAYKANMKDQTVALSKEYLSDYPTAENWRTTLALFRDAQGAQAMPRAQKIDLFRLMRATKSLADLNDYYEYAELTFRAGLPAEAKAVIDEGRASGKIPTSHSGVNALYTEVQQAIRNESPMATLETRSKAAADGKLAAGTADALLGAGNYAKAAELYQLALSKGGVNTADVNTHLGIALAMAGQTEPARTAFQNVNTAPQNEIADFWTFYLSQRGGTAA